jgi:hypothetical protein
MLELVLACFSKLWWSSDHQLLDYCLLYLLPVPVWAYSGDCASPCLVLVCAVVGSSNCCCLQWSIGSCVSVPVTGDLWISFICIACPCLLDKWDELLAVMTLIISLIELEGCQQWLGTLAPLWTHLGDDTSAGLGGLAVLVVEVTLAVIIYCLWVAPLLLACCGSLDAFWVILLLDCQ